MTQFIPSPEQQAIFDAVLNTKDNVAIAALAGTGKTSSLIELSKRLPATGSKIFCAFNKDIVNELESRLTGTGVKASTFHSIGFSALKKYLNATAITPQGDKYKKLVEAWGNEDGVFALTLSDAVQVYPQEERSEKMRDLRKATLNMFADLLNLARLKLANWDDIDTLESIVWEYALDADVEHDGLIGLVLQNVEHIMKKAEEQTRKLVIDFTDMIYWGVKWNLRFYQYQWVLVDECQDLSPVQREMIARIISPNGGRIVLVGDPNQAIYAFAGADSDSFALSVERWNCKVLPLTMTRRCTSIITQHAARLVPSFRCPEDKPRGKVVWLPEDSLHRYAKVGDMVLSRIKAPLVQQCLNLIGEGIPAMILGAEIGKALVAILEKLTKRKDYSFPELLKCLGNYCTEQMDIAKKKGDDARAEAIYDQCEAVKFVISAYPEAQSIDALTEKINSLFGDGKRFSEVVTFATIHKSKGLEAERVFILAPDKLPLRAKNMTPEQEQQEGNLDYVARTRAKHTLVYITNKKFLEKEARPIYVQDDFEDKVWDKPAVIPNPAMIFRQHFESKLVGLNVGEGFYSEDGLAKAYICPSPNLEEGYTVLIVRRRIYTPESLPIEETITKMWDFNANIASWTVMPADKWLSINSYERIEPEPVAVETPTESTETFPSFHTAMSEVLGSIGTTHVLYALNDDHKMCVFWSARGVRFTVKSIAPDGAESHALVVSRNDTLQIMKEFQPQATHWQFLTLAEWEEIHPTMPALEPVVDAVFKPDGLFVEAFTPAPVVDAITTPDDPYGQFQIAVTALLALISKGKGLFAVDGDTKMYVAPNIAKIGMFFVETVNGEYTTETLTLTEALAKMYAFSPIPFTWNTISSNDWMFATAQHKTMKERKAEAQSTPLVVPAPLPFASIMKQHLTELLTTYEPDRGLCADGETTTMYISANWEDVYMVYERDYGQEDDFNWSRDTKDKSAESVLKKMEAINPNPDAWRIVGWGDWLDGTYNESTTDEQESPAPVADEPPAVIEASIEQPVIVADEPPTPSADALLIDMLVKAMYTTNGEFGKSKLTVIA
ncbi:MAG: ATP-dependent helicase, partial [bacterium]|nr:ATP-dependent helicase [bacterium]